MNPWDQLIGPVRVAAPEARGRVHRERRHRTPWGVTPGQAEILELVTELGSNRAAAQRLGRSVRTIEEQLYRARQRMGARSTLEAVLMWDRQRRQAQDTARRES
ncbi:LuxR C-terminal-related transcriptional regulator [Ramlibacter tataouinensis]|uniref:Transcriptional regulator, LuxR family-like protein n=1 Tax=Ramlibacter tataouinensis (strain ATCC BAA-407 / DSM 14655 / LMG 21543 / TTB310) TaxID=365046 RepID=F5XYQ8_RAMTT|nr:LuxR C-terminal-related transcriptional regulator [Ramlibacter tataouinensis]AEG94425.1 transcriptional regulator, LuxR family-like protein [Ramlibacter tataouinensis TTB310]